MLYSITWQSVEPTWNDGKRIRYFEMYEKENRWAYNQYCMTTEMKKSVCFDSEHYDLNLKSFRSRNCKIIFLFLFAEFDNILNYMPSSTPQRFTNEKSLCTGRESDFTYDITIMSCLTVSPWLFFILVGYIHRSMITFHKITALIVFWEHIQP
jgi:hypothetical protein